jgi:CRISPR-associated protein Cas1
VRTRREQVAAYADRRGADVARSVAAGKLRNQANLLRYFAKYRKRGNAAVHEELSGRAARILALSGEVHALPGERVDLFRTDLLNREGRAGAEYWGGVATLLRGRVAFAGREHRGAADPVNAALNYGYGILQSQVWTAVTLAGLEPFAGFIHTDRPGKPSLVLDLMEEFRQPVVDRALLAAWGRGWSLELEGPQGEDAAAWQVGSRRGRGARAGETGGAGDLRGQTTGAQKCCPAPGAPAGGRRARRRRLPRLCVGLVGRVACTPSSSTTSAAIAPGRRWRTPAWIMG